MTAILLPGWAAALGLLGVWAFVFFLWVVLVRDYFEDRRWNRKHGL